MPCLAHLSEPLVQIWREHWVYGDPGVGSGLMSPDRDESKAEPYFNARRPLAR